MMKFVSPLIFLIILIDSAIACNRDVDESRRVVFLNTNGSINEVNAARDAACRAGKGFVVLPENTADMIRVYTNHRENLNEIFERYEDAETDEEREEIRNEYFEAERTYTRISADLERVGPESLRSEIRSMAERGIAVDTLIASGHDGGGSISGVSGGINKYEIRDILQQEYADRPDLLAQFNHVLLWGCYTTTEYEVNFWKSSFPDLDMIAGFLGSGPADDKLASSTIIRDLIRNSERLTTLDDEANVRRELRRTIEHLHYTLPGLYLETGERCDGHGYYYSREGVYDDDNNIIGSTEVHGPFEVGVVDCDSALDELMGYWRDFQRYFEGELPIPENTSSGPLRNIYSSFRENEHCLDTGNVTGDTAGLLLFYNGVVDNFLHTFEDDVSQLPTIEDGGYPEYILGMLTDEIEKRQELISNPPDGMSPGEMGAVNFQIEQLKQTAGMVFGMRNSVSDRFFSSDREETFRDRRRLSETLSITEGFHNLLRSQIGSFIDLENDPQVARMERVRQNAQSHLWSLDRRCMDFLEWHERVPGHTAVSTCQPR